VSDKAVHDAHWVEGIRRGDPDAFAAQVRAYYTGLFDFACTYTRAPEAAEDLVQDVLLKVWEGRHDWQPRSTARAYLYGAVRNRALNYVRDRKRQGAAPLAPSAPPPEPPAGTAADADLAYRDLLSAYEAAVAELPDRRRLIFRLSRLYGLTYREIAETLDLSLDTVRSQIAAALRHLRERLLG